MKKRKFFKNENTNKTTDPIYGDINIKKAMKERREAMEKEYDYYFKKNCEYSYGFCLNYYPDQSSRL